MLLIHPLMQLTATVLALAVLQQGIQRFRFQHLKRKATFKWKRHVYLGTSVAAIWTAGLLGGLMVVRNYWYTVFITGVHGKVGVTMLPFVLIGVVSGWFMHLRKRRRSMLPLVHALNNLVLVFLALFQLLSGWQVLNTFVWGSG
jgi:heme/copper-type cytochrome/quinol oxidase subunit 4